MGGSSNSNNSFIPKRGPASRVRRGASQQVYLFTLVSYVLFFATLVASAGVILYKQYIDDQLTNEVAGLNEEINRFQEADMEAVREYDRRLRIATERVALTTSLDTLFAALEDATAETAQITDLSLERQDDRSYEVTASIETDSFDSSIFQREFYEQNRVVSTVSLSDLEILSEGVGGGTETSVSFVATMDVPLDLVGFTPEPAPLVNTAVDETFVEETATESLVPEESEQLVPIDIEEFSDATLPADNEDAL